MSYLFRGYSTVPMKHICSILLIALILSSLVAVSFSNKATALEPPFLNEDYKGNTEQANIPLVIPIEGSTITDPVNSNLQLENDAKDVSTLQSGSQGSNSLESLVTCNKLPVSSVIASGNDGNVPSNVLDNSLNTRWSNLGTGSWIQLDLGSIKSICSVDIVWYRGDVRQNNFVISVSNDGTTFNNKLSDTSSLGSSAQKFTLPGGTEGRYVRITVNGNTENDWASITEISVFGGASSGGGGGGNGGNVVGTLLHKWQTSAGSGTWSSYTSLGGNIAPDTDLAVAMNSDGRLQVFVVGTNNQLFYKTQTAAGSNTWTGWTSLGGGVKADTSPAVARNNDGRLQVFVVGTNNQLYYKTQSSPNGNIWSSLWTSLGGGLRASTDPIAMANDDGRLQVFVVGTNNVVYYKTQTLPNSATWSSSWTSLGGGVKADTSPAVARNNDGRLQVFIVGTNNQLQYRAQTSANSNTWSSSWTSLSGTLRGGTDPAVIANSDGRLQVFVIGTNNAVYYKAQSSPGSNTWSSSWTSLGGGVKADTGPAAARNTDGRLQAFVTGTNGALYYKTQSPPNSATWSSSWTSLSGILRDNSDPAVVPNSDGRLEGFVITPVVSSNQRPTADSKSVSTTINTPVEITLSGHDPENSPLTFSLVTPPSHGQLSPLPLQSMVVYTPTSGFTGSDSFSYVAKDGQGATSATPATITITVSNGGGGLDPNGVKTIYQTVGQYRTDFSDPRPSDSMRWSVEDVPPNIEMTGYFKGGGSNTIDMKLHGGFHNRPDDREGACTYIITIPLEGGDTYLRTECPHPVYKDCTSRSGAAEADSLGNEQWRGYKAVIWNKANGGVHMEAWEDQGNNDGATPANKWVRLFSYDHDPGQTCGLFSEPLLQPRSPNNNETTFRIDDNSNTQAKWLSIVEIQPEGAPSIPPR